MNNKMEKCILVEYPGPLATITDTFKLMQRNKILDFDVSNKYIVFGTSSGGIYVFRRIPCNLIKFIPSTEGPTLQVKISSDETHIAIANSKGLVVILENFFNDFIVRPSVQNEHEENTVTTLNWHGNELFSGDNTGKVSVFSLAKAFFQKPSAVILNLDSSIVQIDNYNNYFLVSTKTRCYLCNGEKGIYRQIGEKLRNCDNGACFNKGSASASLAYCTSRELFKLIANDIDVSTTTTDNVKIFCARPRGRLWEVNLEPIVLKTYNLKHSPQSNVESILIENTQHAKLKTDILKNDPLVNVNLNFNKIYCIANRFLVTYDSKSFNIFDLETSTLLSSKNTFENIMGLKVLDTSIFICSNDFEMKIISISSIEEVVVNSLLNKQYYLCAELCLHFKNDIVVGIDKSTRLSLLLVLKNKLTDDSKILEELNPIFASLESNYRKTANPRFGGIVTIENGFVKDEDEMNSKNGNELTKDTKNISDGRNDKICCIYSQYNLNKYQKKAALTEYRMLIDLMNLDDILLLMEDFQQYIQESETNDIKKWIQEQLIQIASIRDCDMATLQPKTVNFLTDAFVKVNLAENVLHCKCYFPLPEAHKMKIEYCDVGEKLFMLLKDKMYYLNNIPHFYSYYLKKMVNFDDISNLHILVQFSDLEIVKQSRQHLTYDTWDNIIKLYIQLRKGRCLNCTEQINTMYIWSWNNLGLLIIRSIGSKNTLRLLKRYSSHITNGELSTIFFKGCIMTETYEDPSSVMDLVEQYFDNSNPLNNAMEKYLQRQYMDSVGGKQITTKVINLQKCSYCNLPLSGPIINQYKKCICGNSYHYLCFVNNDKICNNCLPKSIT